MKQNRCPNLNHSRGDAPVRFCPACGEVVNGNVNIKKCSEEEHAIKRRNMNKYCVDCGTQLVRNT